MKIFKISSNPDQIEISGSSLTVYHRTKNQEVGEAICDVGFMAGGGAAYGVGIYSTYNLGSSLRNPNLRAYGGQLVKALVNVNKFLIFDYEISKLVHGSNYRLIDQIQNVIGLDNVIDTSLDVSKDIEYLKGVSESLEGHNWTSDFARKISAKYNLDKSGVNGIIFTGRQDGNVCVTFKESLVTPMEHAWVDGKTYKAPNWIKCDSVSKEHLEKISEDEAEMQKFTEDRKLLQKDLSRFKEAGEINLNSNSYPSIPDNIFDSMVANFLYVDESRINRLGSYLRNRLKDVIEVDFVIKRIKAAPTVYWKQYENLNDSIKSKMPERLLIDIWEDFIVKNPGYWNKIPDSIRKAIPIESEAQYWMKLLKKNPDNWKHAHPEIIEYVELNTDLKAPDNLAEQKEALKEELVGKTEELEIPSSAMGWVSDTLQKLNKRAGRLGLRPITHEVIRENPKNRTQTIQIHGNVPYMKGWKLVARISRRLDDNDNAYNDIETLSDEGFPENMDLENAQLRCDDCGHNRKRNECFVIKNESATKPHGVKQKVWPIGTYLMIGSSCLKDFIADLDSKTSPQGIAQYAENFRQTLTLFKEGNQYQDKSDQDIRKQFKNKGVPIAFFLSKVMQLEDQFGFLGRKEAKGIGKEATADLAWSMCIDLDTDRKYSTDVNASHLSTIYNALDWISNLPEADDPNNEFFYKMKKSCESGAVLDKRGGSNIVIVSWLPEKYRQAMQDSSIDYRKISGEKDEEIFFAGTVTGKKPVMIQISQQVKQGVNMMQNYMSAKSDVGRKIVWMETTPIQADINQPIYLKGKVSNNVLSKDTSITVLEEVQEISEQEYEVVKPQVEKHLQDLSEKQKPEIPKAAPLAESPQGNYQNGARIVERYTITGRKQYGQNIGFFLRDNFGKRVSTFTNLDLGGKGDQIILEGTVQFNKGYINLINITVSDGTSIDLQPSPASQPNSVGTDYQDGQDVEDDFTIERISPANYGSQLYYLTDSSGRKLSSFIKGNIGQIGDAVRLQGKISIKGQYTNLVRVKVVPRSSTPPTKPVNTPNAPSSNVDPSVPNDGNTLTSSVSWYSLHKNSISKELLNFKNTFNLKNIQEQQIDSPDEISVIDEETDDQQIDDSPKHKESHELDLDKAYDMFSESYMNATGKTWDKNKFLNRSGDWLFYGDDNGYIAVRPQQSGLYKLVGIAGDDNNPMAKGRSLVKAFSDLISEGKPTWGMVSQDLKAMAERMGMKSPSSVFVKNFIKYIPSGVLGGAKINQFLPDGGIEFEYQDIGKATKYFIANNQYFEWLKQNIDLNSSIPKPAKFLLKKTLDRFAKNNLAMKYSDANIHVINFIDLEEVD